MTTTSTKTISAPRNVCLKISKRFSRANVSAAVQVAVRMACETGGDVFVYANYCGAQVVYTEPTLGPLQRAFRISWADGVATISEIQN